MRTKGALQNTGIRVGVRVVIQENCRPRSGHPAAVCRMTVLDVNNNRNIAVVPKEQLIGDPYEAALSQDGFFETIQRVAEWVGADIFHMDSIDALSNLPHFSYYTPTATTFESMIAR
jgi:hypothetical protein